MPKSTELLTGVSADELEALAEGVFAPASQARLAELLARNAAGSLSSADGFELDRILNQVDQLAILKARALYTLRHSELETAPLRAVRIFRNRSGARSVRNSTIAALIAFRRNGSRA